MNATPIFYENPAAERASLHAHSLGTAAPCLGLLSLARDWRDECARQSFHHRVQQQIGGQLFPELPAYAGSGFYFLHIPKTAGTSTNRFFERLGFQAKFWLWDQLSQLERRGLPVQTGSYSGHFHMHLEPHLGRRLVRATILRDPVARTVSHYLHVRRAPDHPAYALAQVMDLKEFCVNPLTRHMIENYQARYLVDFGIAPRPLADICTAEDLFHFRLQDMLERITLNVVSNTLLYQAALENLKSFAAVGVTEQFQQTMERFAHALGFPSAPQFNERHNAAEEGSRPPQLDAETLRVIRQATEVDHALHAYASSL